MKLFDKDAMLGKILDRCIPEPNSGCWLWLGTLNAYGYGVLRYSHRGQAIAHRVAYEILRGPIQDGLSLDHLCRIRCCVNPRHLEPVTRGENVRRGENNNRAKTHCIHGHEFSKENTRMDFSIGYRRRICRECARLDHRISGGWTAEKAAALPPVSVRHRDANGRYVESFPLMR